MQYNFQTNQYLTVKTNTADELKSNNPKQTLIMERYLSFIQRIKSLHKIQYFLLPSTL